jgi:PhzF family phenazine biosynthesis protein
MTFFTMPSPYRFHQVDVFTAYPMLGNPLAVVHDASGLDSASMAAFARWINLPETTFLLPATEPQADYQVRIFTPTVELPFAGHPTLGSAWAWLATGGCPKDSNVVVQQCGAGLVPVRCIKDGHLTRLDFAAPPLLHTGPLEAALLVRVCEALHLSPDEVIGHQWVDNGAGWLAVQLRSASAVRAVQPDQLAIGDLRIGIVGSYSARDDGDAPAFEVRAFFGVEGEDPVTGSLNAGLGQWLIGAGLAPDHYVATQGHALARNGRVHVERVADTVWVGGNVTPLIEGTVFL